MQGAIELAGGVLPGYEGSQFNDRIFVVQFAQPRKQFIAHVAVCDGHRVGILERDAFRFRVKGIRRVCGQRFDLFIGHSQFAADRSVDVLSKLTTVERSDTAID